MLPGRDRWLPLLAGRVQAASALDEAQLDARAAALRRGSRAAGHAHAQERARSARAATRSQGSSALMREAAARRLGAGAAGARRYGSAERRAAPGPGGCGALACAGRAVPHQGRRSCASASPSSDGFPPQCAEREPMIDLVAGVRPPPRSVLPALLSVRGLPAPAYSDEDWARVRDVAQVLVLAAAELDAGLSRAGRGGFSRRIAGGAARARHARMPRPISVCASTIALRAYAARRVPGYLERAARAGAPAHGRLAARRRTQRVLRRRSDAVDLRLPPGGSAGRFWSSPRRASASCDSTCSACSSNFRSRRALVRVDQRAASRGSCRGPMIASAAPSHFGRASRALRGVRRMTSPRCICADLPARAAEAAAVADSIEARRSAASRVAHRRPGARAHACARDRARAAHARHRVSGRGYRASAGSRRGARSGHADLRAAASRRSHRVAGGAARAVGGARL